MRPDTLPAAAMYQPQAGLGGPRGGNEQQRGHRARTCGDVEVTQDQDGGAVLHALILTTGAVQEYVRVGAR